MPIRTTQTEVEAIIEVDTSSIPDLTPFIAVASMLVDAVVDTVENAYTNTEATIIETWLSAHFYAIRDNRVDTEKAGPVSQKNQFRVGLNLNVTIYGQNAMIADYKGGLGILNKNIQEGKRTKVELFWAGTPDPLHPEL